jgi:hypothetical protein
MNTIKIYLVYTTRPLNDESVYFFTEKACNSIFRDVFHKLFRGIPLIELKAGT